MEMELTVFERLNLSNLLPREGNFATLKMLRELKEELSLNEFENKKVEMRVNGNSYTWRSDVDLRKSFTFEDTMLELIRKALSKLNEEGKLKEEQFTLFEKFMT